MALTKADVIKVAPEFASVDDPTFSTFLEYTELLINRELLGRRADLCAAFLCAHLLSIAPPVGVAAKGPQVSSQSVGGVSVSYALPQYSAGELARSQHGLTFRQLARPATAGGFVL